MKKRFAMGRRQSKRSFTNGAAYTHKFNVATTVMRGGIRL